MKPFNIDIERVLGARFAGGLSTVLVHATVVESSEPGAEFTELRLNEPTLRRLHELLGRYVRTLDEEKGRT